MTRAVILPVIILVIALGACRRGSPDAPPCGAVGAKFLVLAERALEDKKPDEAMRRALKQQLPAMRDTIVGVCMDSTWSAGVRTCLVNANDHVAFEACEQQLTDAQRRALDRASRGEDSESGDSK